MTGMIACLTNAAPHPAAPAILLLSVPAAVFVPYLLGLIVVAVGVPFLVRSDFSREHGIDKFVRLGPLFYAFPLAVFSGEHFTVTKDIANLVPSWIPWHIFWTYLVGIGLLAGALSIVARRLSGLAATLLGIMFFCFVLLMDIPGVIATPHDRFAQALMLRELSFSAGAFALASTEVQWSWRRWMPAYARYVVGATMVFYGVKHFLHPQNVPVVPLELLMPAWIPFHYFWSFFAGGALVLAGLCLVANWNARLAAAWMGVVAFIVILFVYLPILVKSPGDIGVAMNYFADTLMMNGTFLLVAGSLPKSEPSLA